MILFATSCPEVEPHHKLRVACIGITTSLDLIILYLQAVLNLT